MTILDELYMKMDEVFAEGDGCPACEAVVCECGTQAGEVLDA